MLKRLGAAIPAKHAKNRRISDLCRLSIAERQKSRDFLWLVSRDAMPAEMAAGAMPVIINSLFEAMPTEIVSAARQILAENTLPFFVSFFSEPQIKMQPSR